jgi:hypothetical protein
VAKLDLLRVKVHVTDSEAIAKVPLYVIEEWLQNKGWEGRPSGRTSNAWVKPGAVTVLPAMGNHYFGDEDIRKSQALSDIADEEDITELQILAEWYMRMP